MKSKPHEDEGKYHRLDRILGPISRKSQSAAVRFGSLEHLLNYPFSRRLLSVPNKHGSRSVKRKADRWMSIWTIQIIGIYTTS